MTAGRIVRIVLATGMIKPLLLPAGVVFAVLLAAPGPPASVQRGLQVIDDGAHA
jgi:hypothetical protein